MFIAAPIVRELYGGTAMFYLIITCIPFNVLLYTYGVWRVGHGGNVKLSMRDIITLPLIASFAALHSCGFPRQGARAYMRPVLRRRRGYGADVDDSHRARRWGRCVFGMHLQIR